MSDALNQIVEVPVNVLEQWEDSVTAEHHAQAIEIAVERATNELKSENAKLRAALVSAQTQLRSTQRNWDEQCLFNADDIISKALASPAPRD